MPHNRKPSFAIYLHRHAEPYSASSQSCRLACLV